MASILSPCYSGTSVYRQFGLEDCLVVQLLEQLPNAQRCSCYQFQHHPPDKILPWRTKVYYTPGLVVLINVTDFWRVNVNANFRYVMSTIEIRRYVRVIGVEGYEESCVLRRLGRLTSLANIMLCTLHEDIRPCDAIYTLNFAFPPLS